MIISASRRTDIPAFYSDWFFNRIEEQFVLVRNPMNNSQIRKIALDPNNVECFVFWSKNPKPMLPVLEKLNKYHYYFQFTLNPYEQDIETNLPDKTERIDTFKKLSDKLGAHRVIWRYDPVLVNSKYTILYHTENFGKLANMLKGYTEKVTFSFIDFYSKIKQNIAAHKIENIDSETKNKIAKDFAAIAHENSLAIDTCAEDIDLSQYGINHAKCIDDKLIERITGNPLNSKKDKSQRLECGCVKSADIGEYNSCLNGCIYCYANHSRTVVNSKNRKHNSSSPILIGSVSSGDNVSEKQKTY